MRNYMLCKKISWNESRTYFPSREIFQVTISKKSYISGNQNISKNASNLLKKKSKEFLSKRLIITLCKRKAASARHVFYLNLRKVETVKEKRATICVNIFIIFYRFCNNCLNFFEYQVPYQFWFRVDWHASVLALICCELARKGNLKP